MDISIFQFNKLRTLDIKYSNHLENGAYIYANGKNCISVTLTCEILDKDNKIIELSENDLSMMLYLCKYRNGELLQSPWRSLVWGSEFEGAVKVENTYGIDGQNGNTESELPVAKKSNTFNFYIYCEPNSENASELISVGVNIFGIGKFDTSQNGTNTPNAPLGQAGSVFKSPRFVVLNALPPVDYNLQTNLSITGAWRGYKDMDLVSDKLGCSVIMNYPFDNVLGVKKKGAMYKGELKIKVSDSLPGHYLKVKKIYRKNLTVAGVDLSTPNADIVYGYNTRNPKEEMPVQVYDTSILFIDAEKYGIKNVKKNGMPIHGVNNQNQRNTIKLAPEVVTYSAALGASYLTLSVLHMRHCAYFYSGEEWYSEQWYPNSSRVEILDNYGNRGDLTISFSKDLDNPGGILINNTPIV